jgi:hypothetical protein
MKIILVGNGSSIMDHKLGEYIDSEFDLVYRINRFKTKGFEQHVGSRIDGWFLADTGVQWLEKPTDEVEGSCRYVDFKYVFICMPKFKFNNNQFNHITSETIQLLSYTYEDKINSVIDLSPYWPTSGLITIQFLIDNYEKIYVHGFDGASNKYKFIHYYDEGDGDRLTKKWTDGSRTDHNFNKETKYMNLLREENKVIDIS